MSCPCPYEQKDKVIDEILALKNAIKEYVKEDYLDEEALRSSEMMLCHAKQLIISAFDLMFKLLEDGKQNIKKRQLKQMILDCANSNSFIVDRFKIIDFIDTLEIS